MPACFFIQLQLCRVFHVHATLNLYSVQVKTCKSIALSRPFFCSSSPLCYSCTFGVDFDNGSLMMAGRKKYPVNLPNQLILSCTFVNDVGDFYHVYFEASFMFILSIFCD